MGAGSLRFARKTITIMEIGAAMPLFNMNKDAQQEYLLAVSMVVMLVITLIALIDLI